MTIDKIEVAALAARDIGDMVHICNFNELVTFDAVLELIEKLKVSDKELERERMRLAACGTAALGYFEGCHDEYKSASLADVLRLRDRLEAAEKDVTQQGARIEAIREAINDFDWNKDEWMLIRTIREAVKEKP